MYRIKQNIVLVRDCYRKVIVGIADKWPVRLDKIIDYFSDYHIITFNVLLLRRLLSVANSKISVSSLLNLL